MARQASVGMTGGFITVSHQVLDAAGPMLGLAAIGYYCWLRRHVNGEPSHPLHGYAWPGRRYTCSHFGCHHSTLSKLEGALQAAGLLSIEPARALSARGEVDGDDLARVLSDPYHSFIYTVHDLPGGLAEERRVREERVSNARAGVAAAAIRGAAETAPRGAAAGDTEKAKPEKPRRQKHRPEKDLAERQCTPLPALKKVENGMLADAVWELLLEGLKPDRAAQGQLESLRPLGYGEGWLYVEAPSGYTVEFVSQRFAQPLERGARALGLSGVRLVQAEEADGRVGRQERW